MNICIPVEMDKGLESKVYGHFGSAPAFLMVDTATLACRLINNNNQHHAHGMCNPVAALAGQPVEAVMVGGIGMGALMKLNASGIQVFHSRFASVRETVEAIKAGRLAPMTREGTCGGHGGSGHGSCGSLQST